MQLTRVVRRRAPAPNSRAQPRGNSIYPSWLEQCPLVRFTTVYGGGRTAGQGFSRGNFASTKLGLFGTPGADRLSVEDRTAKAFSRRCVSATLRSVHQLCGAVRLGFRDR